MRPDRVARMSEPSDPSSGTNPPKPADDATIAPGGDATVAPSGGSGVQGGA
ncbi:MAG: hydrogenase expression protein, partial [Proteobacteria bacterium]|nr:hydrogenase expression protein [Pseudomonadota bacterium]